MRRQPNGDGLLEERGSRECVRASTDLERRRVLPSWRFVLPQSEILLLSCCGLTRPPWRVAGQQPAPSDAITNIGKFRQLYQRYRIRPRSRIDRTDPVRRFCVFHPANVTRCVTRYHVGSQPITIYLPYKSPHRLRKRRNTTANALVPLVFRPTNRPDGPHWPWCFSQFSLL